LAWLLGAELLFCFLSHQLSAIFIIINAFHLHLDHHHNQLGAIITTIIIVSMPGTLCAKVASLFCLFFFFLGIKIHVFGELLLFDQEFLPL